MKHCVFSLAKLREQLKGKSDMLQKSLYIVLGALLALGVGIPAVAQQNAPTLQLPLAGPGPYFGPYAQAQALVQDARLTGSKGISSLTHPTTGVYCLKLASGVQLKTALWFRLNGALRSAWPCSHNGTPSTRPVQQEQTYLRCGLTRATAAALAQAIKFRCFPTP